MESEIKECTVWEDLGIGHNFLFGKVMQDSENGETYLHFIRIHSIK